jgi:hypothetical protein
MNTLVLGEKSATASNKIILHKPETAVVCDGGLFMCTGAKGNQRGSAHPKNPPKSDKIPLKSP